jgi:hypothetical protein
MANGGNGFTVRGERNQLLKLDSGDRGKGNGGDGFYVRGLRNVLSEGDAVANRGDGFDVAGAAVTADANRLTKNVSNKGSSGSDQENAGAEFRVLGQIFSGGGNKVDNTAIPSAAKFPAGFPANNATKNFSPAEGVGE